MNQELTAEDKAGLKKVSSRLTDYPKQRGNLIPILQMIQEELEYLPPKVQPATSGPVILSWKISRESSGLRKAKPLLTENSVLKELLASGVVHWLLLQSLVKPSMATWLPARLKD
jgi:hypothetical protein